MESTLVLGGSCVGNMGEITSSSAEASKRVGAGGSTFAALHTAVCICTRRGSGRGAMRESEMRSAAINSGSGDHRDDAAGMREHCAASELGIGPGSPCEMNTIWRWVALGCHMLPLAAASSAST